MALSAKPWRVELLGGLQILREGREPVVFLPSHPNALLAYLALHFQRVHTREELSERLWPEEESGEVVQQKLRRCLYVLRRRFEQPPFEQADLLQNTRQTIGLDPNLVCTDVQEFKDALSAAAATTDLAERQRSLAEAVHRYRGDLLPGFYQDCFVSERNRLADLYADALHLLTQVYEQAGDLERAVECARRVVALDPLMEEAHCTLMRLFAAMGQPSAVLKQYQDMERVLKEAFGESPSAATRQLMETLRERAQANVPHSVNGKPPPVPLPETDSSPSIPQAVSLPSRSAPLPARRSLLLGGVGIVALLAAIGSLFLHPRAAAPKQTLLVPDAKTLWVARYSPAPDEKDNSEPTAMTTDSAGNLYITGFISTLHNDVDYLTLKYDPDGKLLWRRRYNGPGNDLDRARSIAVDQDGNVYVTGESDNGKGNGATKLSGLDWATIKYDKDGNRKWVARYNDPDDGEDRPVKLCVDAAGNVYVAGDATVKRDVNGHLWPRKEWEIVKYDSQGRQVWAHSERAAADYLEAEAVDMAIDPDGNVYVTGSYGTARLGRAKTDLLTVKYAPSGDCLWRKTYPGKDFGDVFACRIALDGFGNVYVTGEQYDGDLMNNGTQKDIVTLKYDAAGNEIWCRVYDNAHLNDTPHALAVDKMGNVTIAGQTGWEFNRDYLVLRYSASGSLEWMRTYNGKGNAEDCAVGVALDRAGNAIVTGCAFDGDPGMHAGTDSDYVTIKYSPAGRALWKGTYDGNGLCDKARLVAVDNNNAVIVTGQSDRGHNTPSITTIKYPPDASGP